MGNKDFKKAEKKKKKAVIKKAIVNSEYKPVNVDDVKTPETTES